MTKFETRITKGPSKTPAGGALSRRELLRATARYGVGAGLLAGVSLLVLGVTDDPADRHRCVRPIACGECDVFGKCPLPKAQVQRVALRGDTGASFVRGDAPVQPAGDGEAPAEPRLGESLALPGGSRALPTRIRRT